MNLLLTGVSGYLGQAVVHRLLHDNPFSRVIGVDNRPPALLGPVRFVRGAEEVDLGDLIIMNDVQVVLHLMHASAGVAGPTEVRMAGRLIEAARLAELPRLVWASSDVVYLRPREDAVRPIDQAVALAEGAPLADEGSRWSRVAAGGKVKVERMMAALQAEAPSMEIVGVRVAHLIGDRPGAPLDEVLRLPWIVGLRGVDPPTHFLHIDDAAEIFVRAAATPGVRGALNAAGAEPIPLSAVAGLLEKRLLAPPPSLMRPLVGLLRRLRLSPLGSAELTRLHMGVALDGRRLEATLGYAPRYTTRQTLAAWRVGQRPQALFQPARR